MIFSYLLDNLGKRNFKPYLEEFMEPLFYACESENLLARSAGEQTVQFLSGYLGPSILRGRVNNLGQPRYSAALERIMSAEQPMEVGGESGGMSIPVGLNKSSVGGGYSNLGGTPT